MIQRKQTIYFAAVFLISFILLWTNPTFFKISGYTTDFKTGLTETGFSRTLLTENGQMSEAANTLLSSTILMTGLVALICVFLFKMRKWQMILSLVNFLFMAVILFSMYRYSLGMDYPFVGEKSTSSFTPWAFVPLSLFVLNFLAYRGVKKDDELIRSIDRIR
jgi:lysylphosphatidylglycerol synthetase-like protein (DUF2156 family)